MRDFKGQHVCPISLPTSPCHDHQTVPIMLGWSLISRGRKTIPVEQAEKFVTMVNITTTKTFETRGRTKGSHRRKKKREKTILRIPCSWTFSHSLDPERKSRALANGRAVVKSFFCPGLIPPI